MSQTETKPAPNKVTSNLDILTSIANQDTRQIVQLQGVFMIGAVEDYEFNGNSGETAFLQIAVFHIEGSKRMEIKTVKVEEDKRGLIDILNQQKSLKPVSLQCEIRTRGKQSTTYLTAEQPALKLS